MNRLRILDLQRQLRELGRIRMGEKRPTSSGKLAPAKLAQWRLTSASREHLEAAAQVYGGEVRSWDGAGKPAFELYTTSDRLRIVVPSGESAFSQAWELWSGGGCDRRCDGFREQLTDEPCRCPSDPDERRELAAKGQACKPTTRISVMLPDVPDIGVWRLETHGFYAALELAGAFDLIELATRQGRMIPAYLRIDQREVKRKGQPVNRFAVPVIEIAATTGQVLAALGVGDESDAFAPMAALEPPARRALESGGRDGVAFGRASVVPSAGSSNGGPPLPPLPHEIVDTPPAELPVLAAAQQIAMRARDAGLDDDARHTFIAAFTAGRTTSGKDITPAEMPELMAALVRMKRGEIQIFDDPDDRDGPPMLVTTGPDGQQSVIVSPLDSAANKEAKPEVHLPTEDEWRDLIRAAGLRQPSALKVARGFADDAGLPMPGTLGEITDPMVAARLIDWIDDQSKRIRVRA